MIPKLIQAIPTTHYRVRLRFEDGTEGEVDLQQELWGEVFEPLKAPEAFKAFRLDRELNTITWNTGADFAPEFLYDLVRSSQSAQTSG